MAPAPNWQMWRTAEEREDCPICLEHVSSFKVMLVVFARRVCSTNLRRAYHRWPHDDKLPHTPTPYTTPIYPPQITLPTITTTFHRWTLAAFLAAGS